MSALTLNATPVPIASCEEGAPIERGDRFRSFDNTARQSVDGAESKRRWSITTTGLTPAEYADVRAILLGAPPITASGDALGGTFEVQAEIGPAGVAAGAEFRRALSFDLEER